MDIKKILVIADQDHKEQFALHRAAQIAALGNAQLHVVAFAYQDEIPNETETNQTIRTRILEHKAAWLNQLVGELDNKAITQEVIWSKNIHQDIINVASDYSIVIKTIHKSKKLLYTPTDWHLIRELQVPLLLVTDKTWQKKHNLLLTLDLLSKDATQQAMNQAVMETGIYLSNLLDATLNAVYVPHLSEVTKDLDIIDVAAYESKSLSAAEPIFNKMVTQLACDNIKLHVKAGVPEKVIDKLSNQLKSELLVVGTRGRTGLKGAILGNTAEKMLANLHTDALIIPT